MIIGALALLLVLLPASAGADSKPASDPFDFGNPSFCAPEKPAIDFGLSSLPAVHELSEAEVGRELGHPAVNAYGGWSRVMSKPEEFGYGFSEENYGGPVRVDWTVTAQLWSVDAEGDGAASLTARLPDLSAGVWFFRAVAVDAAGNSGSAQLRIAGSPDALRRQAAGGRAGFLRLEFLEFAALAGKRRRGAGLEVVDEVERPLAAPGHPALEGEVGEVPLPQQRRLLGAQRENAIDETGVVVGLLSADAARSRPHLAPQFLVDFRGHKNPYIPWQAQWFRENWLESTGKRGVGDEPEAAAVTPPDRAGGPVHH